MTKSMQIKIGVIIVSYQSSDVLGECLASLANSTHGALHLVVCDNASPDQSRELVRGFAVDTGLDFAEFGSSELPAVTEPGNLTLITSSENLGYAGAVNLGLDFLMASRDIDHFWVLNPDSVVEPGTATAYATKIAQTDRYALMGGRTLYFGENGMIQSDGGRVNRWTGICSNVNVGRNRSDTAMPDADDLDFLSGANLIASREFVVAAGKMRDDYFLYYEEVDWAFRRGDLPLVLCPEAVIYHHAGTAIGSGTTRRRPSGFANYFNYRNRAWFIRHFHPMAAPVAYLYSFLKVLRLLSLGAREEAAGAWRGLNNQRPPKSVADRVDPSAHKYAFQSRPNLK